MEFKLKKGNLKMPYVIHKVCEKHDHGALLGNEDGPCYFETKEEARDFLNEDDDFRDDDGIEIIYHEPSSLN